MTDPGYLKAYRDAVQEHGASFEATLWGSPATQRLRFDVLLDGVDLTERKILDLGCGQGDLAQYLLEREIPFGAYVGFDAMDAMIDVARQRNLARSRFEAVDLLAVDLAPLAAEAADWAIVSGTLNTMEPDDAVRFVERTFQSVREGVAFNFLGDRFGEKWKSADLGPARRADTLAWLDRVMRWSPLVCFNQTYLDGQDVTIIVRH